MLRALAVLLVLTCASCGVPRWPAAGVVTSPYGLRLAGLVPQVHHGVDVSMPVGTPVRAMKRGRVAVAGEQGAYGLVVVVDHGAGTESVYAHLSAIGVQAGDAVNAGDVLGASGRSGNATGAHLHFEVRRWGRTQDPVPLLGGAPPAP